AALSLTVDTAIRLRAPFAAVGVALAFAFDDYLLLNSVSGLETALACLAVAIVFRLALEDRPPLAAALISVLVRPELAVLVAALVVFELGSSARRLRPMLVAAAALLLLTAARWALFHDVLPNTFWAKSGGTRRHLALGLAYIYEVVRDFPLILLAPLGL